MVKEQQTLSRLNSWSKACPDAGREQQTLSRLNSLIRGQRLVLTREKIRVIKKIRGQRFGFTFPDPP
jgi:hypothetical protein